MGLLTGEKHRLQKQGWLESSCIRILRLHPWNSLHGWHRSSTVAETSLHLAGRSVSLEQLLSASRPLGKVMENPVGFSRVKPDFSQLLLSLSVFQVTGRCCTTETRCISMPVMKLDFTLDSSRSCRVFVTLAPFTSSI